MLGRVDDWAHARAGLQIQSGTETEGSTTICGMACEFGALADLEELQIEKSP